MVSEKTSILLDNKSIDALNKGGIVRKWVEVDGVSIRVDVMKAKKTSDILEIVEAKKKAAPKKEAVPAKKK
jgi:hypothetical protein